MEPLLLALVLLQPTGTNLNGARKELADAIAGPESGSWGYEALLNQGEAYARWN